MRVLNWLQRLAARVSMLQYALRLTLDHIANDVI